MVSLQLSRPPSSQVHVVQLFGCQVDPSGRVSFKWSVHEARQRHICKKKKKRIARIFVISLNAHKRNTLKFLSLVSSVLFVLICFVSPYILWILRRRKCCTYGAAAFVRLVSVAASLSASEQRRAADGGRLALAESAVVLIHGETLFAVQTADELGADPFVVQRALVCRGIMRRRLTGAHWATILVLNEVAVQSAVRQIRTNFVIFRLWETRVVSFARYTEAGRVGAATLLRGENTGISLIRETLSRYLWEEAFSRAAATFPR